MIRFICPGCETKLEVSDRRAGTTVRCPECRRLVSVPTPASPRREPGSSSPIRSKPAPAGPHPSLPQIGGGKGRSRPSRPRQEHAERERSGANTGLIIACAGGGAAFLLVVVLVLVLRPGKNDKNDVPAIAESTAPVRPAAAPSEVPPVKTKEEVKPAAPPTEGNPLEMITLRSVSEEEIYPHILKTVAWVWARTEHGLGMGTGTVIDAKNKWVLTSYHVVPDPLDIFVFFPKYENGKPVTEKAAYVQKLTKREDLIRGKLVDKDAQRDLALIQIERCPEGIQALPVAQKPVLPGQNIRSVGSPGASTTLWQYIPGNVRQVTEMQWTAGGASGAVYNLNASAVLTNSAINPGDSGGPLVNDRGELVGVTHGVHPTLNSMSLFINVTHVLELVENHCRKERLTWARETRILSAKGSAGDVARLTKQLGNRDDKIRAEAAEALATLGPEAKLAVPALLKALKEDTDDLTRRLAAEALNKIGPPNKTDQGLLRDALKDSNPTVRSYAARAVGQMGPDAYSLLRDLLQVAKDADTTVRQNAVRALGEMGPDTKETVLPVLTEALKDRERDMRVAAAEAIAGIRSLGPGDLPLLIGILKHQDAEARLCAARALGQLGRQAKQAIPGLMDAFKAGDIGMRRAAMEALALMGREAKDAVAVFSEALADSDKDVRKNACLALAKLGPDARAAVPSLRAILTDPDRETRRSAATALAKIGPAADAAVKDLADALKEDDDDFRIEVLGALGAIGPKAKSAIPNLIAVLEGYRPEDKAMRVKIAEALGKIGKDAVPALRRALYSNDPSVRSGAALALGEIGPPARQASAHLATLVKTDRFSEVRESARLALSKVSGKP